MKPVLHRLCATLIASTLVAASAFAQTPAPKKPAPTAKKNAADKLQTKEELRACMQLKESNNARTVELDKRNEENRKEKAALQATPDGTDAVRADVQAKLDAVKAADNLVREHAAAVSDWNERSAEFEKKSKDIRNADQQRRKFKQERIALSGKDEALVADRNAKVAEYEKAVAEANDKIASRAKLNEDWNMRNDRLADEGTDLQASRDRWLANCANRRFITDDEKEIKAGK